MRYIPRESLDRLKDYSYKGVDKYAYSLLHVYVLNITQVSCLALCVKSVLDLVRYTVAFVCRTKHSTRLLAYAFISTDIHKDHSIGIGNRFHQLFDHALL